jgi:hypothetical protein
MVENFADSFNGKLLLLLIDKIVIGAIIAFAFLLYDRYKTADTRKYEAERARTQLSFERSRLLKEFLPVIDDWSEVRALGLHKPTRFALSLQSPMLLPWCVEYFVAPSYLAQCGIIAGSLTVEQSTGSRNALPHGD